MAAIEIIAIRAPEYSSYENLDSFISIADSMTGPFDSNPIGDGTLGTTRDMAIALRTLHMICKRDTRDGAKDGSGMGIGGSISSEREGFVSRSMTIDKILIKKYPDLVTTIWGMELIALIKSCHGFSGMTGRSKLEGKDLVGMIVG